VIGDATTARSPAETRLTARVNCLQQGRYYLGSFGTRWIVYLVKARMEATHAGLRELWSWRNLESEANDILAKGDVMRAVTQLSEAAHEEEYDHSEDWGEDKGEQDQRRIFVSL